MGRGQAVGLCLPRTNSAVAAIVGVLLAGAAYVPLDPAYPADRLAAMCARVAMPIVLGPPALTAALPHEALTLDVDALDPAPGAFRGPGPEPGDPAYILFTSGSTGTPKGVQVSHGNVMALLGWVRQAFDPSELSLVAASTSFNFDPSVLELFGTAVHRRGPAPGARRAGPGLGGRPGDPGGQPALGGGRAGPGPALPLHRRDAAGGW